MTFVLHFDGGCEPVNPGGVATWGCLVLHDGRVVHEGHGLAAPPGPGATNNVAEYSGLLHGLAWLVQRGVGAEDVVVRGDSQLVIMQMRGEWAIKAERLKPLHAEAKGLAAKLPRVKFEWVRREQNAEADALARLGYAAALDAHPEWRRLGGAATSRRQKP